MSSFEDRKQTGMVFNIQKYSVHDGPGIRTIVFLKGCPMKCWWCSNPESQARTPELAYNVGRCLTLAKCVRCAEVCTRGAIQRQPDDTLRIDREHCAGCAMPCAEACPSQGMIVYGEEKTVDDVLRIVEQDAAFYIRSGGGMTISGGEPLMQGDFAVALLREARKRRIKTAIETCGLAPWSVLEAAAPFLSSVLFDIKHMDSDVHADKTGVPNGAVLDNFAKLATLFPATPILARTPIIPGFNDSEEAVAAIADFLQPFGHVQWELLPYHRLGTQKYTFLDRQSPMGDVTLEEGRMKRFLSVALDILGERVQNLPR